MNLRNVVLGMAVVAMCVQAQGPIDLFGKVAGPDGSALSGVRVSLVGHPELADTTDNGGMFALANGITGVRAGMVHPSSFTASNSGLALHLASSAAVSFDLYNLKGACLEHHAPEMFSSGEHQISFSRQYADQARILKMVDGENVSTMTLLPGAHFQSALGGIMNGSRAHASIVESDTLVFSCDGYATLRRPVASLVSADSVNVTMAATGLVALTEGMQMTVEFKNSTRGQFADDQIYICAIARNEAGAFCSVNADGSLTPCVSGGNTKDVSIKLSDMGGMQFPKFLSSGRLYVSYGKPLDAAFNTAGDGSVGIAFPNIENGSDANINSDFDWIEFAVINGEIWCNTTQVDQFGFPMVVSLYTGTADNYSLLNSVGVSETGDAIRSAWAAEMPAEFKGLAVDHRILAPIHGGFRNGGAQSGYFDAYVDQIWQTYNAGSSGLAVSIPQGVFVGKVGDDGRMAFVKDGDATTYYIGKPSSDDIWGGMGTLASGNTIELVLEAQMCAAFHRHVVETPDAWSTVSSYYGTGPCDYFAKFWHEHSIGARAYGFCYDDVNDQSSTIHGVSPRGIVLNLGW